MAALQHPNGTPRPIMAGPCMVLTVKLGALRDAQTQRDCPREPAQQHRRTVWGCGWRALDSECHQLSVAQQAVQVRCTASQTWGVLRPQGRMHNSSKVAGRQPGSSQQWAA